METPVARRSAEAGYSVVEGLIAAALLLIVTVGILPLLSRAKVNNVKGNDSTREANGALTEFERSSGLPFNGGAMTVPDGVNQLVETSAIALKAAAGSPGIVSPRWENVADLAAGDQIMAQRTRTLRQYSFDDFRDDHTFDSPLPGESEDRLVHMKIVDVSVGESTSDPSAIFAPPYRVRMIQAY
jgi:hypothetical protein